MTNHKESILCVISGIAMLCCFAKVSDGAFSKALEAAFAPDARTGTISGNDVRRLINAIKDVPATHHYAIESNICHRILDFPLATNAHTTTWALIQKRSLFFDMAALAYWKTNRVAMLTLADHLGTHSNIDTNFFETEFPKAHEQDMIELAKAREQYKRSGTVPTNVSCLGFGPHKRKLSERLKIAKIWNDDIRQYRGWALGAFSDVISNNCSAMTTSESRVFVEEFIRRGKLTPDEVKQVFGSLPESTDGTSGGSMTNITTVAP